MSKKIILLLLIFIAGSIQTISAQEITATGTVVSGRASKSGNILLNLDKQFPNQVFTVFIKKENIPNFSYDILTHLRGKKVFVTGKISGMDGLPVMYVDYEKQVLVQ